MPPNMASRRRRGRRRSAYRARWKAISRGHRLSDRGPGIPADQRERVVERFVRLDESRTKPGNGLGLSLVAGVMKLHGGQLRLRRQCARPARQAGPSPLQRRAITSPHDGGTHRPAAAGDRERCIRACGARLGDACGRMMSEASRRLQALRWLLNQARAPTRSMRSSPHRPSLPISSCVTPTTRLRCLRESRRFAPTH